MRFRKTLSVLCACAVLTLSGCFGQVTNNLSAIGSYDFDNMHLVQFDEPYEGQPTAEIKTTLGTMTVVLYPEYAPETVNNFIARVREGFYDGKSVYGVYEQAYFMTGAYDENRNSGVTETGEPIPNECTADLWAFRGALCAYNGKPGFGDSRFFVVNKKAISDSEKEQLKDFKNKDGGQLLPDELIKAFCEHDCIVDFGGCYTVFAQTIEGFDVIDKICTGAVSGDWLEPDPPVIIEKITLGEYRSQG